MSNHRPTSPTPPFTLRQILAETAFWLLLMASLVVFALPIAAYLR